MKVNRTRLLSLLTVATVWSVTMTFLSPVFWIAVVVGIFFSIFLMTRMKSAVSALTSAEIVKLILIFSILTFQMAWGGTHGFYNLQEIIFVCLGALLALVLCRVRVPPRISWAPFYVSAVVMGLQIVSGVNPEEILGRNSRNFLSVILIGLFASAILMSKPRYVTLNHFVAASVTVFVSVVAIGRGGIVFSTLLWSLIALKWLFDGRKSINTAVRNGLVLIIAGVLLLIFVDTLFSFAPRLASRGFHDYSRLMIANAYFADIAIEELIFGRNYFEITFLSKFNYNLHNSYLSAWANIGLFYLLLVLFAVSRSVWTMKLYPFLWIPVLALAGRAFVDVQMIGAKYDYVFLTIFLLHRTQQNMFQAGREPK